MGRFGWMMLAAAVAISGAVAVDGRLVPLADAQAQSEPPAEAPYGLTTRRVVRNLTFPLAEPVDSDIRIVRAFPAFSFNAPLYLTVRPGDDSELYVVSQRGVIDRFPNDPAATGAQVRRFLDIDARVTNRGGEEGLLGFAFHPDYDSNGFFYVYYTATDNPRRSVLSRFSRSAVDPSVGDPASEQILLTINQPFANHNGGCLQFGPDGKLYIASGDGGSGNDPQNHAQNLNSTLGKLLRLNDDGSIPSDNPFAGTAGARGEIWALGLRNPWRFSFDKADGRLWLGDVGQNAIEEVNVIERGGNYGWRVYEGNRSNGSLNPQNLPPTAFDAPVYTYGHDDGPLVSGQSITGGYVYRGSALPGLVGSYLFADFVNSRVWGLQQERGVVTGVRLIDDVPNPASFGQDNAGNVYVVSFDGFIYRLEPNVEAAPYNFPQLLSQTGLFRSLSNLTPVPGLIEYQVNAPFWSDGTLKRRWLAPNGRTRIGFRATGPWTWQYGTVIVKHFEIDLADGTRKRLETRVMINGDAGWRGYTYRWNEAGNDAVLLPGAATVELDVLDAGAPTGASRLRYEFPSRSACLSCHNAAAGFILGLRTDQMNRDFLYPGNVLDNQVRAFNNIGLFAPVPAAPSVYRRLSDPEDTSASLSGRARAYLDSNCSQCHRPGGPTPVQIDLRASTGRLATGIINTFPSSGDLGQPNARVVRTGRKELSVLWLRMNRLDDSRMPPIGSHAVDRNGVALIGQWIDAGAP